MQITWRPEFDEVMAVGREGLTDERAAKLKCRAPVSHLPAAAWDDVVASRSEDECWDLLRGFVILEERLGWGNGSVSAGNLLGRAFVQRFTHRWLEAVAWIKDNAKSNGWYFTKHSPLTFNSPEHWQEFLEAERQRKA
jgi:hypothetical protein